MNVHVTPSSTIATTRRPRRAKTVTALYTDLEQAHAAYVSAVATRDFDDNENARDEMDRSLCQPAWEKFSDIGEALIRTPIRSLDELLLKLRAALAVNGAAFKSLSDLDNFDDYHGLDGDALVTLKHVRDGILQLSRSPLSKSVCRN